MNQQQQAQAKLTRGIYEAMADQVAGVAIESDTRWVVGASWHEVDGIKGYLRLDWIDGMVPEDLTAVDAALADVVAKVLKWQEVQTAYAAAIAAGYDTGLGFSLKLGEQDQRVLFDYQQRLLRQLHKDPPEVTAESIKPLMGTDDNWHLATVQQIIDAVDGGAGHIESINAAYAGYAAMIGQGVTDFEVDFSQA